MITLRRAADRRHIQRDEHHVWLTFHRQELPDLPADGFGILLLFDELRIPPGGAASSRPRDEAELVTYVYQGALTQQDSTGSSGVIHAGEFQRWTTGHAIRCKESNASRTDWAHVFRITLRPSDAGLRRAQEQKRFAAAQRRNVLCVVVSPDARKGSLRIHQDALVHSSVLDPGHHLVHELLPGRSAWLHVICGEATLDDLVLTGGDGVGVTSEPSVSLTAQESTEILLVDLGPPPRSFRDGAGPSSLDREARE